MTYAGDRVILDADSHVMQLTDFLNDFIDPDYAARLRRRSLDALSPRLDDAVAKAEARRLDPNVAARAEERLMADKGWVAMGGFDPRERSRVLDLLGFDAQLVFATFATAMFSLPHKRAALHGSGRTSSGYRSPLCGSIRSESGDGELLCR
jgi:uncharacterized protein